MSVLFDPSGSLNVAHDPSDLPEEANQGNLSSGAMVRCKNLRINQKGIAKTRDGSAKLNDVAISEAIWWLEIQAGVRYAFAGTAIYRNESSIATGLTSAQWSAIQYNAYNDSTQNVFATNGTDRKRIQGSSVYEWGIDAPTVAPTLGVHSIASLSGDYNAKYTYARKVGSVVVAESDPSPAAPFAKTLSGQMLSIVVTQPSDTQVTHIRVYRTSANGAVYNHDQDVPILTSYGITFSWESDDVSGTSTKFTTADSTHLTENTYSWEELASRGTQTVIVPTYSQPPDVIYSIAADADLGDLIENDHDRPPLGSYVFGPAYDGTCFLIKDNLLYYCKPKQPEYWPSLYYIEVSTPQFPGRTGVFHNGQVYYFTANEIYYIQGTGNGTFFPLPMKAKTGAQSVRGAVSVTGRGIFHTGPDGIYLFSSGNDVKITEDTLEPIFRGETIEGLPSVSDMSTSWLWTHGNHLYFGYASTGYTYPTNVLVFNLDTNRLSYHAYNDGAAIEIRAIATDHANRRLVVGDTRGFVRVIESSSYTSDSGAPILWEVQSKDYMLQTRRHFPRFAKYDVDSSSAASCAGSVILDGEIHQIHVLSDNRDTRRRLIREGNGNKAAIRISGSGQVSIYAAEFE